jgi:hypothetical protein
VTTAGAMKREYCSGALVTHISNTETARETSMTPDERQLITGLFDRMRSLGPVEKDRDAEALISRSVQQVPEAPYMLVQCVLVQEHALQQADQRIRDLEEQVQRLEARAAEARSAPSSGSFLGGLFGGQKPEAQAQTTARGSVPVTGRPSSFGGPPLGAAAASPMGQAAAAQPWGGGGFLRSAMATAAGVAGGMLLADSIRGLMGASPAKAAPQEGSSQAAAAPDNPNPQEAHDQGFDANDPGSHDPNLQDADYGADAGDWGGGGDFEI